MVTSLFGTKLSGSLFGEDKGVNASTDDCLILDIRLPGISGLELYRQLAESGEKPPVIFITAEDEPAVRDEAKRLGASSYLTKPFSGRALLESVTQALLSQ